MSHPQESCQAPEPRPIWWAENAVAGESVPTVWGRTTPFLHLRRMVPAWTQMVPAGCARLHFKWIICFCLF